MSANAEKVTQLNPPTTPPTFYARLSKIQSEIERIRKTGVNQQQNYKFVEEGAIMEAVKPLLAAESIFMTIKQVAGKAKVSQITYGSNNTKAFMAEVDVVMYLMDGLSDAKEEYPAYAYAIDAGDKAFQKALTSAGKYAVLRAFMISTGVDLDNDGNPVGNAKAAKPNQNGAVQTGNGEKALITRKQLGYLIQLIRENALSEIDVREIITHETGRVLDRYTDLTLEEGSKVIECIKGQGYMGWLKRLHPADNATPPATDAKESTEPYLTDAQAQKIVDKIHALGGNDDDLAASVDAFTNEQTSDHRKLYQSEGAKFYKNLVEGIFVKASQR
jgi:ERF superfamily protein